MNANMIRLALVLGFHAVSASAQTPAPAPARTWEQSISEAVAKGGVGGVRNYWHTLISVDASNHPAVVQQMLGVHYDDSSGTKGRVVLYQIRDPKTGAPSTAQLYVTDEEGANLYKASALAADGVWRDQDPADAAVLKAFVDMKAYWLGSPAPRFSMDGVSFDDAVGVAWEDLLKRAREKGYSNGEWNTLNLGDPQGVEMLSVGVGGPYVGKVVLGRLGLENPNTLDVWVQMAYVTDVSGLKPLQVAKMRQDVAHGAAARPAPSESEASEQAFREKKQLWLSAADLASDSGVSGDFDWVFSSPANP